ncbi:LysR family transcriptional regulator [Methylobrevis pamukkalensis]|uniref:HTH-type transcriptional regulator GltC n=1 Tax=Methylobrevis pamukkalensis TaxID=1439726 RepID=A0A1E3H6L3_9HYPH|nr:LysR family transcriptional regulator [Methylobrevis pamukkalensis]ODN71960.1 HTH-type transcriptional regulator GltC [Methylobrevis pamukkalensis]
MLHSRKLQYIDEIARCGSIRKAASRLNVASSAVNRQIIALEEEIGAPLFERLPRGLRLTAAGELYIEHIREVLKDYQRLESRIRGLRMPQAGRVSMVTTVGLAAGPLSDIVARFVMGNPRIRVQLRSDGPATTLHPVLTGEVDLGLGFNLPATPGIRTLGSFSIPLGLVAAANHPLARRGVVNLADAAGEPLVLAQPGTSLRNAINLALSPLAMAVEPLVETNSMEMMKKLVRAGVGLTFMNPLDVLEDCRRGDLVFLPIADDHVRDQPLKLFARSRAPLDAATSLFVEYLLTEFAALVGELRALGWMREEPPAPALA